MTGLTASASESQAHNSQCFAASRAVATQGEAKAAAFAPTETGGAGSSVLTREINGVYPPDIAEEGQELPNATQVKTPPTSNTRHCNALSH